MSGRLNERFTDSKGHFARNLWVKARVVQRGRGQPFLYLAVSSAVKADFDIQLLDFQFIGLIMGDWKRLYTHL